MAGFAAPGMKRGLLYLIVLAVVVGVAVVGMLYFERNAPTVSLGLKSDYIGSGSFEVQVADRGRGLKRVTVSIAQGGAAQSIVSRSYLEPVAADTFSVAIAPDRHSVKEGPAVLRVTAVDRSFWGMFRGNRTVVRRDVTVDLTPPGLSLRQGDRYVSFGGSGVVVYEASPDTVKTGVSIGSHYFPAHPAPGGNRGTFVAFFAHPYDVSPTEKAVIVAEDPAGNLGRFNLPYTLKPVRYRKRTIKVTDDYIQAEVLQVLGGRSSGDLRADFLKVNRDIRRANDAKIKEVSQKSVDRMLWEEPFHQLSNSKVEANFADHRTYVYHGEEVDQAYHLGFDLAVTRNYPVEAANDGIVVFAGDLGIYGNTVILDHGYGLFTLYSHLSAIDVEVGQSVKRKEPIAKTGQTGLATGDHLHYTTLIYGVPVLPLEWWDPKWVKENVLQKIRAASGSVASGPSR